MADKFYAVRNGRKSGIYKTWDECKEQVDGFAGARYKSFKTLKEAQDFLSGIDTHIPGTYVKKGEAIAYVDGSYDERWPDSFGYGVVFITGEETKEISGKGVDAELAAMRNVAGEVRASMEAIKLAIELGIKKLTVYHDYEGIAAWPLRKWKANKEGTIAYRDYFDSVKDSIEVSFVKVKGHAGVEFNELADTLAKRGLSINE
ncbi:MAG: ribonuclease H family protein [Lachnospiraceae bacterium]|nr:ribonuclease H family protein [Lachnospiraceae bacterium]